MLFGKSRLEMKVGIFVFFGIVILVVVVLSIGGFKSWSSGRLVKFNFNFINGVKIGAPVRFAGMDVGQVKRINLIFLPEGKTKIEIVGWVEDRVKIPVDSTVWVNTLGLLGEKYIEIMPGKDTINFLSRNQILEGEDPIPMQEVERLIRKAASDIDATIVKINNGEGTIGKLLFNETIYNELEALIKDVRKHPWKLFWKTKEKK
ncbi:MAG: MCE family protein [Candidatus Omnitrophica bacterium]|nr:MCE family protein [Candidatus Omnitrophota bacterium]